MPKRIIKNSREDPARAILGLIASASVLSQVWAVFLTVPWYAGLPNLAVVGAVGIWALASTTRGNAKHMAWSSFWLSAMWTWTGITRLIIVEGVGELLWVPFLIVGMTLGVTYLHFAFRARVNLAVSERKGP